jgi:hypothetical protein
LPTAEDDGFLYPFGRIKPLPPRLNQQQLFREHGATFSRSGDLSENQVFENQNVRNHKSIKSETGLGRFGICGPGLPGGFFSNKKSQFG